MKFDRETAAQIPQPLLYWYAANARKLPWRTDSTPYHVWVSEIMLQQTRVEAVKPYYERFIAALPDIEALAACPQEELMKLWEGLGYYSRVRNLQRGAQQVLEQYGGVLPHDAEELHGICGIGPYTAGAIASIAYGRPAAAVDGNVLRVLTRLCCDDRMIDDPAVRRDMGEVLTGVYPPADCSAFTQGLMELGACVCLPGGVPLCRRCPLSEFCRAYQTGTAMAYPCRAPKKPRRVEPRTVLLLCVGDKVALQKRPPTGLLAGLWEFPSLDGTLDGEAVRTALTQEGLAVVTVEPLPPARHIFTHIEWQLTGFRVTLSAPDARYSFVTAEQLRADYAVPSAFAAYRTLFLGSSSHEEALAASENSVHGY